MSVAFDEGRHEPGGPGWLERWTFEAWDEGAALGALAAITLVSSERRAWYWSALIRDGEPLLTIVDTDLRMPATSLAIRGEGLWADHICETPLDHWTIANEAFAVALDDADEALGAQRGVLVPLGLDLEWEARGAPASTDDGYVVPARVSGEILVADSTLTVDVVGRWRHEWGVLTWPGASTPTPVGLRAPLRIDRHGQAPVLVERVLARDGWHEWLHQELGP